MEDKQHVSQQALESAPTRRDGIRGHRHGCDQRRDGSRGRRWAAASALISRLSLRFDQEAIGRSSGAPETGLLVNTRDHDAAHEESLRYKEDRHGHQQDDERTRQQDPGSVCAALLESEREVVHAQ